MKEIIVRTQEEWKKLRKILARKDDSLPHKLPAGRLAAALLPARGENAAITGHYTVRDEKTNEEHLFIEWKRVAEKKEKPEIAFIENTAERARLLKVFNPDIGK